MKIAITAKGNDLGAELDPRFGRAGGFIIYDLDSENFEHADNSQNLNAAQGAGIQTASNIEKLGAKAVITGHCGPNAFKTLSAAGIDIYLSPGGTVSELVEKFKAGELKKTENPDVSGHWV